jgi:hypothetical protein
MITQHNTTQHDTTSLPQVSTRVSAMMSGNEAEARKREEATRRSRKIKNRKKPDYFSPECQWNAQYFSTFFLTFYIMYVRYENSLYGLRTGYNEFWL